MSEYLTSSMYADDRSLARHSRDTDRYTVTRPKPKYFGRGGVGGGSNDNENKLGRELRSRRTATREHRN